MDKTGLYFLFISLSILAVILPVILFNTFVSFLIGIFIGANVLYFGCNYIKKLEL